jgi:hypothetical protein
MRRKKENFLKREKLWEENKIASFVKKMESERRSEKYLKLKIYEWVREKVKPHPQLPQ